LAAAYQEELTAMEYRATGARKESFEKASQLFLDAGRIEKAAQCQEAAGNLTASAGECQILTKKIDAKAYLLIQ